MRDFFFSSVGLLMVGKANEFTAAASVAGATASQMVTFVHNEL